MGDCGVRFVSRNGARQLANGPHGTDHGAESEGSERAKATAHSWAPSADYSDSELMPLHNP